MARVSHMCAPACAQLDEKAYANLVAKRRVETGGFIVGDADGGCVALSLAWPAEREGRGLAVEQPGLESEGRAWPA